MDDPSDGPHEPAGTALVPIADTPAVAPNDAVIERWFADHFPNSVVARSTECWNLVRKAADDLKTRLSKEG